MDEQEKLKKTDEDVKAAYGVAEKGVQSAWDWAEMHMVATAVVLGFIAGYIVRWIL